MGNYWLNQKKDFVWDLKEEDEIDFFMGFKAIREAKFDLMVRVMNMPKDKIFVKEIYWSKIR